MNEKFKSKYLKYKSKYVNLQNIQIRDNNLIMNNIKEFKPCEEVINLISSTNNYYINNEENLGNSIYTNLDLSLPERHICNHIFYPDRKASCNIYYNKCKLKYLYRKYIIESEPEEYTIETLNKILLNTIPNNQNEDRTNDQTDLIIFGSNLTTINYDSNFFEKNLTNITIPNSVTTIGERTFMHNNLTTLIIPRSVITIGAFAFFDNQLTNVIIPDSIKTISPLAFLQNRIVTLIIPNSVINIGNYAFYNNKLTTVTIPIKFQPRINEIFEDTSNITFTFI